MSSQPPDNQAYKFQDTFAYLVPREFEKIITFLVSQIPNFYILMVYFEDLTIAVSDPVRFLHQRNWYTHFPSSTLMSYERYLHLARVYHGKVKL